MTTAQDPNATVAFDVVSAPAGIQADAAAPADNFSNELSADDEPIETTPADGRPLSQKEKVKVGALGAAAGAAAGIAGTAAAMTYGADALHSIQEAGASALHSVQDFLGIDHGPDKPATPAQPVPPAPQTTTGQTNGPAPDPNAPGQSGGHHPAPEPHAPTNIAESHPVPPPNPTPQPEPQPEPQAESHLIDLDGDGKADAVVVDDHGTTEMIIDMDHDGQVDAIGLDTDHDGQVDAVLVDVDHDGIMDIDKIDSDHDSTVDTILVDTDGDHGLDTVVIDSNHDGQFTAEDQQGATGHDVEATYSHDQGLAVADIHPPADQPANSEDVAQHDGPGATDNYDNHGDVHEWA